MSFPEVLEQASLDLIDTGGSCDQSSISHSGQKIGCSDWSGLCHMFSLIQWESTPSEIHGVRVGSEWFFKRKASFCYQKMLSGFPGGTRSEEPAYQSRRQKRCRFDLWVRKTSWRRKWLPTPVLLPGEFHGQRSLVGYSSCSHKESDTAERLTHKNHRSPQQDASGSSGPRFQERGYFHHFSLSCD